jgi:phosphatidylglycerophosphatase GEP4
MGQSVNWAALRVLALRVAREPRLAVPRRVVRTIADVDWAALRADAGVRYVVFDKDNTLTAPYADEVHASVRASLRQCVAVFGAANVCIMSNSAGTPDDKGARWQRAVEAATALSVVVHRDKKPLGFGDALAHLGCDSSANVAVVGDRLLTDTVMGNLAGALTIHCSQTLETRGDNVAARVARVIENALLRLVT